MAKIAVGDKYLVTGASGQLGTALTKLWSPSEGLVRALPKPKEALDVTNPELLAHQISTLKPSAIVNCAAYTDVRGAEKDPERCWQVNVGGVYNLAAICIKQNIPLFHVSTDYVFGLPAVQRRCCEDDEDVLQAQFTEDCPVAPQGVYAASKAAAEHTLLQQMHNNSDFQCWILRTSGLFEKPWRQYRNFPYKIANMLLTQPRHLSVVRDVTTTICAADELAATIDWIVDSRGEWLLKGAVCPAGVYHVANKGVTTWYDVACRIARGLDLNPARIHPVSFNEFREQCGEKTWPSPRCSALCCDRLASRGGPVPGHWTKAIDDWCQAAKGYFS